MGLKSIKVFYSTLMCLIVIVLRVDGWGFDISGPGSHNTSLLVPQNATDWDPAGPDSINLPVTDCDTVNQTQFAELRYLDMLPPCEETSRKGYCGIRRNQNITLIAKFATKTFNEQYRVRVHLVDKNFGFETAVWPEFGACHPFFNMTCPQEQPSLVHTFVYSELPREIPGLAVILRVRLVSVNEDKVKNVAICRQINIHVL